MGRPVLSSSQGVSAIAFLPLTCPPFIKLESPHPSPLGACCTWMNRGSAQYYWFFLKKGLFRASPFLLIFQIPYMLGDKAKKRQRFQAKGYFLALLLATSYLAQVRPYLQAMCDSSGQVDGGA